MTTNQPISRQTQRFLNSAERLNHLDICVPRTHFHYTSVESALLILESAKFKLSHPDSFNDPFELDISVIDFNCDAEIFMHYTNDHKYRFPAKDTPKVNLNRFKMNAEKVAECKTIFNKYRDKFGIGCFSSVYNNILMWSHYAQSHKGVCIGFDYTAFNKDCFVYPVKYVKKKPVCKYFDTEIEPLFYVSYLKSKVWSYEKEIRIVHYDTTYLPDRLLPFEKDTVVSLYLGLKTSTEDKERILQALEDYNYDVDVFGMTSKPNSDVLLKFK